MDDIQRAAFVRYHVMVPLGCGFVGSILGNVLWEIVRRLY